MKACLLLLIFTVFPSLLAQEGNAEKIAAFIQSPPPIREMVVECTWFATVGETNTNWMALAWQTNAYVLRESRIRTGLWDIFDTNKDEVIAIRSGDLYSTVSNYKLLGVHVRQVEGLKEPGNRDIVTPLVLGQQNRASSVLSAGVPLGWPGTSVRSNGTFEYHNQRHGVRFEATMNIGPRNEALGFEWTSRLTRAADGSNDTLKSTIHYVYDSASDVPWFPREMIREMVKGISRRAISKQVVHRLEFGMLPSIEFYPERFLPGVAPGKVTTSNGISHVTYRGVTKPMKDPKDPRARGVQNDIRGKRGLYAALAVLFALGTLALALARRRSPPRRHFRGILKHH